MNSKITLLIPVMVSLFAFGSNSVQAGSDVFVGKQASIGVSIDDINHDAWNELVAKYVDQNGMVNYKAWKAASQDVRQLDSYLQHLSDASLNAPAAREAKLAFWINAYNSVTVRGILREYPTSSIRNHTARLWGYNIWKNLKLYVGGQPKSLEDIEHKILRKMSEPRIHFAIVCASVGCPRLLNRAYEGDQLEEQLDSNAKDFFSRQQNFRHDSKQRVFHLSAIMDWFGTDFGANQRVQLNTIADWLPTQTAQNAARINAVTIRFQDYDWNLNEQTD